MNPLPPLLVSLRDNGEEWGVRWREPAPAQRAVLESGAAAPPAKQRAELRRCWDHTLGWCAFVGLNPGEASDVEDDNTARKYRGFARRWGFGGYVAWNLFELVATNPDELWAATLPTVQRDYQSGLLVERPLVVNPPHEELDDCLRSVIFSDALALPRVKAVCLAWGNAPGQRHFAAWHARATRVRRLVRESGRDCIVAALTSQGQPAHLCRLRYQPSRSFQP